MVFVTYLIFLCGNRITFLLLFIIFFTEIKSNYILCMLKIKTMIYVFPHLISLLFFTLVCFFCGLLSNLTFTLYLCFSLQLFQYFTKKSLAAFDFYISQKIQRLWNTSSTYNTLLTYMLFYVCFNYFYTLNSHSCHCTIYIYIYTYENLWIISPLKNYRHLSSVYFLPISSYFTLNYLVLINITHDHSFNRWIAGIQLLTNY